ncbi:hypothetical protein LTSEUGA_1138, partial [Salmonella enterica subsp. enterica serovar Uganda str. R8-3404]
TAPVSHSGQKVVLPDIHVSSCVLSILQVIVIFRPVGLKAARHQALHHRRMAA